MCFPRQYIRQRVGDVRIASSQPVVDTVFDFVIPIFIKYLDARQVT